MIYYRNDILERFIPVDTHELVEGLLSRAETQADFESCCQLFLFYIHSKFHHKLTHLKRLYLPFSPDPDTVTAKTYSPAELNQLSGKFLDEMRSLLDTANFDELSETAINEQLNKISPHGIKASVDFDDFEHVALFYRGSSIDTLKRRDWKSLWLREDELEVPVYRRLFVLIKLKDPAIRSAELIAQGMTPRKAQKHVAAVWRKLPQQAQPSQIYLKLFKDMPESDLEMLFPTVQVKLKLFDKIRLAITGGGGTVGGIVATVTKLSTTLNPVAIIVALAGLVGVIARQVANLFHQRTKYMMTLAQHLYFHNLSNNLGVLSYLLDMAEDEENKEAILAYYFLLHAERRYSGPELDQRVEAYIHETYQLAVDFEVQDGLRKLREARLLREYPDRSLSVVALDEAKARLLKLAQPEL